MEPLTYGTTLNVMPIGQGPLGFWQYTHCVELLVVDGQEIAGGDVETVRVLGEKAKCLCSFNVCIAQAGRPREH